MPFQGGSNFVSQKSYKLNRKRMLCVGKPRQTLVQINMFDVQYLYVSDNLGLAMLLTRLAPKKEVRNYIFRFRLFFVSFCF